MNKKYVTGGFSFNGDLIREVEIERESEQCVWINGRRESKHSEYRIYHDSWSQAHEHLLSRAECSVAAAEVSLKSKRENLEKIRALTQ